MSATPVKQWSALLPLAMSIAGLALVLGHVAVSGGVPETDEGTAARLWWLLMGAQVPVVAWFAITWLPQAPTTALVVLASQAAAVLANLAAVRYFNL
jgi:hypothetical protein